VGLFQVLPDFIPGENQSGVSCQCPEGECDFMLQDLIPSGQGLQVGDSVRFGAFNMTILTLIIPVKVVWDQYQYLFSIQR
jgi:hypothetical protein